MNIDKITNDEIVKLRDSAQCTLDVAEKILKFRQTQVLAGLYSENKLIDEMQLAKSSPEAYYCFNCLQVRIYIRVLHSTNTYCVSCENWQYKPEYELKNIKVYKGIKSYGSKETLSEAVDLFYQIVSFYVNEKLNEGNIF